MEYPKQVMTIRELCKMGFIKEFLMNAYRQPGQRYAMKENFLKKTSMIIFDTVEFEKWRLKNLASENKVIAERW